MAKQAADEEAPRSKRSRRELIAGAAGALGVMAAQSVAGAQSAMAADGDPVILGAFNAETNPTYISNEGQGDGLSVTGGGPAPGHHAGGTGVVGVGGDPDSNGVLGAAQGFGIGVLGHGGVTDGVGVVGTGGGANGTGVRGIGAFDNGTGVEGRGGGTGAGVRGISNDPTGRGVVAENTSGGAALLVNGPAVFSRSGLATIPAGFRSVTVGSVPLTPSSLILAMIQQTSSRAVRTAVPDPASSSLTITLTATADVDTTVGWFVVN
jgi:hypothetical protein